MREALSVEALNEKAVASAHRATAITANETFIDFLRGQSAKRMMRWPSVYNGFGFR